MWVSLVEGAGSPEPLVGVELPRPCRRLCDQVHWLAPTGNGSSHDATRRAATTSKHILVVLATDLRNPSTAVSSQVPPSSAPPPGFPPFDGHVIFGAAMDEWRYICLIQRESPGHLECGPL